MPTRGAADAARIELAAVQIDAHVATRAHQTYLAVWSDREDIAAFLVALAPGSVPVGLDHVPFPGPGERRLVS